jgi:RNA polymerase sigma-70 factor (ECF subfamily)
LRAIKGQRCFPALSPFRSDEQGIQLVSDDPLSQRERVHSLFLQHSAELRGFILSLLPIHSRADDVLQETFLTVSRKAEDFQPGTNFVAWACSIAKFKVLEDCKRHGHCLQTLAPEVIQALCVVRPDSNPAFEEARLEALKRCVSKLSPQMMRAIELRYSRAHRASEIAELLGWTTDSVYVVLSRARNALYKCIQAQLEPTS